MFFLLGFLVEETPCKHRENMQTPHRKAREIAHLSTVHSGEALPPRANSAPCGNRTHDLLAVRRQCKPPRQSWGTLAHHEGGRKEKGGKKRREEKREKQVKSRGTTTGFAVH